jgi:hypothetical protein
VHALLIDGVLAEAGNLVNGTTITRYGASAIDELEYFNVKLRGDKSIVGCDRGGWGRPLLLAVPIQGMLRDLEHLRTVSNARVARGSLVRSQKGVSTVHFACLRLTHHSRRRKGELHCRRSSSLSPALCYFHVLAREQMILARGRQPRGVLA